MVFSPFRICVPTQLPLETKSLAGVVLATKPSPRWACKGSPTQASWPLTRLGTGFWVYGLATEWSTHLESQSGRRFSFRIFQSSVAVWIRDVSTTFLTVRQGRSSPKACWRVVRCAPFVVRRQSVTVATVKWILFMYIQIIFTEINPCSVWVHRPWTMYCLYLFVVLHSDPSYPLTVIYEVRVQNWRRSFAPPRASVAASVSLHEEDEDLMLKRRTIVLMVWYRIT